MRVICRLFFVLFLSAALMGFAAAAADNTAIVLPELPYRADLDDGVHILYMTPVHYTDHTNTYLPSGVYRKNKADFTPELVYAIDRYIWQDTLHISADGSCIAIVQPVSSIRETGLTFLYQGVETAAYTPKKLMDNTHVLDGLDAPYAWDFPLVRTVDSENNAFSLLTADGIALVFAFDTGELRTIDGRTPFLIFVSDWVPFLLTAGVLLFLGILTFVIVRSTSYHKRVYSRLLKDNPQKLDD